MREELKPVTLAGTIRKAISEYRGPSDLTATLQFGDDQPDLADFIAAAIASFKAGDEEPRAPVCVLCGSRNADPRGWDLREPVCPDCQDRRSPTTHKAGS